MVVKDAIDINKYGIAFDEILLRLILPHSYIVNFKLSQIHRKSIFEISNCIINAVAKPGSCLKFIQAYGHKQLIMKKVF